MIAKAMATRFADRQGLRPTPITAGPTVADVA